MKKTLKTAFLTFGLIAAVLLTSCAPAKEAVWFTDFETAQTEAAAQNKDLFILFSGMDWDGLSRDLLSNILDTEDFKKAAGKNFVIVNLDLSQNDDAIDAEQLEKNQEIAQELNILSFPTMAAVSVDKELLYEFAYDMDNTTISSLIAELKTAGKAAKQIKDLKAKINKSTGAEKVTYIDELISVIPNSYVFQYIDLVSGIPELDPENKSGLVGKYKVILAYPDAISLFYNGDIDGAVKIYTDLAEDPMLKNEEKQEAYYMAATIYYQTGDIQNIKEVLEKAIAVEPDNENSKLFKETLEQIALQENEASEETLEETADRVAEEANSLVDE